MKKPVTLLIVALFTVSWLPVAQPKLSEAALTAKMISLDGKETNLGSVLAQFPDQTILIDLWASWCKDCIIGFPKIQKLNDKHENVTIVYLSVDKKDDEWKNGINRFNLPQNTHYRVDEGWENVFCESIELDWIPRYMLVDTQGNIAHFKSTLADDKALKKAIKSAN